MPTAAEDRVHRFADAVSRREPEEAIAECDPDVRFYSVLASVEGEAFAGHEGIRRYFDTVVGAWEEWRVETHRVTETRDGRVAVTMTMHLRGRQSGISFTQSLGHVWELRNGKLWRCTAFRDPEEALAEAGLG